ncbi:MAG TPA: helix-turn-helix domain-containing protein [Acidimicrobiales bacterium]|nr:helix-turn-helix domain-containing protein [Acidimicrobiales bacterium]
MDVEELRRGWRTSEVAALLKVHPNTVSNWVHHGRLKATRTPGGHLRIPNSEVLRLFEQLADRAPVRH